MKIIHTVMIQKKNIAIYLAMAAISAAAMSFVFNKNEIVPIDVLKQAETFRVPWKGMSLVANILTDGEKADSHKYKVFYQDNKTLVVFTAPEVEKGNLLLMNGNDLWFYVNSTNRPTRITPIQRLSGSTSFGDLARLSWSVDYNIVRVADTIVKDQQVSTGIYKFELSAKSPGATYQKVTLWINKKDSHPMKSEVYLSSGKLYKTLQFNKYETVSSKVINTQITFIDHFNKNLKSVLTFSEIKENTNIPNRYFINTMLPEVSNELSR